LPLWALSFWKKKKEEEEEEEEEPSGMACERYIFGILAEDVVIFLFHSPLLNCTLK